MGKFTLNCAALERRGAAVVASVCDCVCRVAADVTVVDAAACNVAALANCGTANGDASTANTLALRCLRDVAFAKILVA